MKPPDDDKPIAPAKPDRPARWIQAATIGRNPKVTLMRIAILVAACAIVFKLVLLPIRVDGISMFPTYNDRSIHFLNRLAYLWHGPRRGDVDGVRLAGVNSFFGSPGVVYLKRVVGLPGETVAFAHGVLLINGAPLPEPYVNGPCDWNAPAVLVDANQYYFVGDNRSMSIENHDHGKADRDQIVGKVLF